MLRALYGPQAAVYALPAMLACPVPGCQKTAAAALRVLSLPNGDGLYWYCSSCDRGRDSLELYADAKRQGNVLQALSDILQSPDFDLPAAFRADDVVRAHQQQTADRRARIRRWSQMTRERWTRPKDTYASLARDLGFLVQLSEVPSSNHGAARWLHATTAAELSEAFNLGGPTGLPAYPYGSCLALAYQSAPGRISGLWLLGWKNHTRWWMSDYDDAGDPGILALDAAAAGSASRIIAVSSPYLALWLQYKQQQESLQPAPVVAWRLRNPPQIWDRLGLEEVVFWDYLPTAALFHQALRVPSAKVVWLNRPTFPVAYDWENIETRETWRQFRRLLEAAAQPAKLRLQDLIARPREPYAAFIDYLLSLDAGEVDPVLQIVAPNNDHVRRLLDLAGPDRRAPLEARLRRTVRRQEIILGGSTITQILTPDRSAWIRNAGRRTEEQVTDAVVHLDHAYYDENNAKHYLGTIYYRGRPYPFSAEHEQLLHQTASLIMRSVEEHCHECPKISLTYAPRLWDLIWQFSGTVTTLRSLNRVGWGRDDQEFLWPRFAVIRGGLQERAVSGPRLPHTPGADLSLPAEPTPETLRPWLEDRPPVAAWWAVLTAILDNTLARGREETARGIALVGALSRRAAERASRELQLLTRSAAQVNKDPEELFDLQRRHDLPILIIEEDQPLTPAAVSRLTFSGPANLLLPLSAAEAAAAAAENSWMIVDAGDGGGRYSVVNAAAGVFNHFLAEMQTVPDGPGSLHDLARRLLTWAETRGQVRSKLAPRVAAVLQDLGRLPPPARFVRLISRMLTDGWCRLQRGTNPAVADVVLDEAANCVYVSKTRLAGTLLRQRLPALDAAAWTRALRAHGALLGETGEYREVWVLPLEVWQRELTAQQKSQRKAAQLDS